MRGMQVTRTTMRKLEFLALGWACPIPLLRLKYW